MTEEELAREFAELVASNGDVEAIEEWGIDLGVEVTVGLDVPDDWPVAEVMRLRGACLSAQAMLQGGMADLGTKSDDTRLILAFTTYAEAGDGGLAALVAGLDEWLVDHDFPVCSLFPVTSSNLAALGWVDGTAVVEFNNGGVYAYLEVPEGMFAEWWASHSLGGFLGSHIKPNFEARKLA